MKSVWVVIPAYNEERVIGNVLLGVLTQTSHVVVVSDGSSDNTDNIASNLPVHFLRHECNLGQGAALQTGIEYALSKGAEAIVTFDADGQMSSADIPPMVHLLENGECDVVLGTRFSDSAAVKRIPFGRRFLLKLAILFTNWSTGLTLSDAHNGFRVFSRKAAEKIVIHQSQMAHASEILEQIARHKFRVKEFPVTIKYTTYSLKKGQKGVEFLNILWDLLLR